jgi:hypothetical protein
MWVLIIQASAMMMAPDIMLDLMALNIAADFMV